MANQQRPSIIFIITDQMRGDCLSVTGHTGVHTPNLDDLAHKGFVFTAAYSPCPSCIAARAAMFTGRSPSTLGRLGYHDRVPWRYENMLADVLGRAGYQTHCVGKTHFYPQRAHLGFHSMETYEGEQNLDGDFINDYYEWLHAKTDGRLEERDHGLTSNSWNARPSHLPEELHNNSWVVTRGIDFMRRRDRTRPFFLNLSFHRPHPPIDPPQVFYDMYRDRPVPPAPIGDWAAAYDVPVTNLDAWRGHLSDDVLTHTRRAYYAQIAHIDCQIGRLMRRMGGLSVGPTFVIFTADHGEMLGDHHLFRKTFAYEGSARVPMIIRPHEGGGGFVRKEPVVLQDVYSTMLDVAGVPLPAGTEGLSMLPLCQKDVGPVSWRPFVQGEHSACYSKVHGMLYLTDGRQKYIWYTLSGQEQLFDLKNDPQELHDLAAVAAWRDQLGMWRQRMIEHLATRPQDGLTDGKKLIAGKSLPAVRPELMA